MKKTEEQLQKGRIASAKWYAKNKKRKAVYQRKYDLEKLYGINEEQYQKLLKFQKYKCAVCLEPDRPDKKLHIDHSHITGITRGLLCGNCNKALGLLLDSTILLGRLIGYLRTWDFYTKLTTKHLKTTTNVSKKLGRGKKVADREMIKAQNDYVAVLLRAVRKNLQKKEKGTLEEFL